MSKPDQSALRNRILARLSAADFALLAERLEPIDCPLAMIVVEPNIVMPDVLFLERGIASVVAVSPRGRMAEGGVIGREGYVTPSVVLGCDQIPHRIEIQIPGNGHRIARSDVLAATRASETLRCWLMLFAQTLLVQSTYTSLANALHSVDERLARWLLMCHDRSDSGELGLTHEFIAVMLCVRRPSVTNALHVLEGHRYIRADRGFVTIRDRSALEAFAGDAYGTPEAEYRRLMGEM